MNKRELIGLPDEARSTSIFKDRFVGKLVLWLTYEQEMLEFSPEFKLADYFDVIVVSDRKHLATVPNPDIFIYERPNIDTNGVVDIANILNLEGTLICMNIEAVKLMSAARMKPQNYMISLTGNLTPDFGWGGNNLFPTGSRVNGLVAGEEFSLNSYFSKMDKYRTPVNLRARNRKLLMEDWS